MVHEGELDCLLAYEICFAFLVVHEDCGKLPSFPLLCIELCVLVL